MSMNTRVTRAASRIAGSAKEMEGQGDRSQDGSEVDLNATTIEVEGEIQQRDMELQKLKVLVEKMKQSAEKDRLERLRLEQLLHELKANSSNVVLNNLNDPSTVMCPSLTNVAPQSSRNVSHEVFSTCESITKSNCGASFEVPPLSRNVPLVSSAQMQYSWPPLVTSTIQSTERLNTVQLMSGQFANTSPTPSFLPTINACQTYEPQIFPSTSTSQLNQRLATVTNNTGLHKKLHDLPEFSGKPEQWPMFCTAFVESTNAFNYNHVENMFRLQKCIRGEARDVVESLLIHPSNVQQVMATLEFRFGRPEYLVQSQLKKIKDVIPISENRMEQIVSFSTKVQNLTVFLEASGMQQYITSPSLLDELVSKLPMSKRMEWAQSCIHLQPFATVKHFNDWLSRVARIVCIATTTASVLPIQNKPHPKPRTGNVLHTNETPKTDMVPKSCRHCKGELHPVFKCANFTQLKIPAKWEFVKRNKLCFSCLKYGHGTRTCKLRKICGINSCAKFHHQSLHEEKTSVEYSNSNTNVDSADPSPLLSCNKDKNARIFFRILPVRVYNGDTYVSTHALFDEGSSVTIMTSQLAEKLKLKGRYEKLKLSWLGREAFTKNTLVVDINVSADKDEAEKLNLNGVYTFKDLHLPTQSFDSTELKGQGHFNLPLIKYANVKPQILIGLDHACLGAAIEEIRISNGSLIVAKTRLGWLAYGCTNEEQDGVQQQKTILFNSKESTSDNKLENLVKKFFDIDSFGVKEISERILSFEDRRALQLLSKTTTKIENRYQTGLLWKEDIIELPDSYQLAIKRFFNLENKMKNDKEYATIYKKTIANYLEKGYAYKLSIKEASVRTNNTWYLPHFGVQNINKPGKVRIVFDAAAEVNGVSLNSCLLKGPDDHTPLLTVLFNFRLRPIAVRGDIKEMFHQIHIRQEDRNSQRFLWRDDDKKSIDTYVMRAMIFGASCSPCSAHYVMNLNASNFIKQYPRAVESITKHHYVDDYVDSFDNITEAIDVTQSVITIHKAGGFELRSFISNSQEVTKKLGGQVEQNISVDLNIESDTSGEKILGMFWNNKEDVFVFRIGFPKVNKAIIEGQRCPTKREFLSITMSIFDPFGIIANFILPLKLILKKIWSHGIEWDDPIPEDCFNEWKLWKNQLKILKLLKIPRCHGLNLIEAEKVDLHTFVDASEEAFSAVSYLRFEYDNKVNISFVCGKTKCAPKKLLSIPRLELSAAILGIRLQKSIMEQHDLPISESTFWSDSKTVLHWLRLEPRRLKPFVAFRVAEILDGSRVSQWRWVPSKQNPADEATRVNYSSQPVLDNKWISGPIFLKNDRDKWPRIPLDLENHKCREELRSKFALNIDKTVNPLFDAARFQSFLKLRATMARVLRLVNKLCRRITESRVLTVNELNEAEELIYRQVQQEEYPHEIICLQENVPIEKGSKIYKYTPYLDETGIIRFQGRIDAATTVPFSVRRPIILPENHNVTRLIVADYHRRFRHQNDDTVVNEVRQKFWIPSLRGVVKKVKNDCQLCKIRRARPLPPLMGQLPEDRVTPFVRPFTYTGLDYFGPVNVSIGRRTEKRWVALFTCLTVRAIHLEIAPDLSADSCILCIRNFVNRRGVPMRIRSDNGTNFVGANKELLTNEIFDKDAIKMELGSKGIEWVFNCPLSPHTGGCWERLVQSVKRVLSFSLSEIAPKLETLQSALIEAENIVNSRPLTHLPVSTDEDEPLTPNHFILGVPNSTQTPGPIDNRSLCLRKQYRIAEQLKNRFWKRWLREYLPVITRRSKWFQKTEPLKIDDLVLICDDLPRSQWAKGKIIKVFNGSDGQVRAAEVRTKSGILRRPAVKLAVLDVGKA